MTQRILILGATSAIARETAALFAMQGHHLYLASRDQDELARIATDLIIRYTIPVFYGLFDAENYSSHQNFWQKVQETLGEIDGVLLAFGYMGHDSQKMIASNFTGAVSILNQSLAYFKARKRGFIIGISSVAGDRGRQSNYCYGAAKAAFSTYLQGLRNYLYPFNVRVITIKLGFVDTAMTYGLPHLFLLASPQAVAKKIILAWIKSKDIVYIPWFWHYIMAIICLIPERIFKRLRL